MRYSCSNMASDFIWGVALFLFFFYMTRIFHSNHYLCPVIGLWHFSINLRWVSKRPTVISDGMTQLLMYKSTKLKCIWQLQQKGSFLAHKDFFLYLNPSDLSLCDVSISIIFFIWKDSVHSDSKNIFCYLWPIWDMAFIFCQFLAH